MKVGLLLEQKNQDTEEDDTEYESRCFGLVRVRKRPAPTLEETPATDIVERLYDLMRKKKGLLSNFENEEREQRLEALYYSTLTPPNMEMARTHMRISLSAKKMQVKELQKYERIRELAHKIQEARRNKHDAESLLVSSKTLKEILEGTPDVADAVDEFREQLHLVGEHTELFSSPLQGGDHLDQDQTREIEHELDALFPLPQHPIECLSSSRTTSKYIERQPCLGE